MDGLAEARAKHRWARHHAQCLKDAITNSEPHTIRLQVEFDDLTTENIQQFGLSTTSTDTSTGLSIISVRATADAVPVEIPLHLGDALNCFRGALDYAAWALVRSGTKPNPTDEQARQILFPIHIDRLDSHGWQSVCGQRLPGVKRAARRAIREHQPFTSKQNAHAHPLARLADLGGKDKHRRLRATTISAAWSSFEVEIDRASFGVLTGHEPVRPEALLQPGDYISHLIGVPQSDAWRDAKLRRQECKGGIAVEPFDAFLMPVLDAIDSEVTGILDDLQRFLLDQD